MSAPTLTLWALTSSLDPFRIEIPSSCDVQHLKGRIRDGDVSLKDIATNSLVLWKVPTVPFQPPPIVAEPIQLCEPIEIDPENTLTERLNNMHNAKRTVLMRNHQVLSMVWPTHPLPGVHVWATRPTTPVTHTSEFPA